MRRDDDNDSLVYEVSLEADAALEGPFDTWLRDHVADVLQVPGFLSAEVLGDGEAPPGRIRRVVHYRLRDRAALDAYLLEQAPRMHVRARELFGDRYSATPRVLAHREEFLRGKVSTENCLNCGEVLSGQHCSHCGQRAKVRVLSLGSLLRDLLGDLVDYDSRLWRTLRPLAFKPGWLTVEFLRGRRTRYTPPFRMYLTLSVVFFLLASMGADTGGVIHIGDAPDNEAAPAAAEGSAPSSAGDAATGKAADAAPTQLDPERQKVIDAIVARVPKSDQARVRSELEQEMRTMKPEDVAPLRKFVDDPCGEQNLRFEVGPGFKQYEPRLREACRKITGDSQTFSRAVIENVPKMMFVFLPLIAGLMYLLYLGSGRYYVEHLLFFVHFHAFFFLSGLVVVVLARLAALFDTGAAASALRSAEGVFMAALVFYVPYYLYRAMRRVYGQGRTVTLVKYGMLGIGYLMFMTLTVIALIAYTALTL